MVVFPIAAFLVSLACAVVIALDAVRKPRPDKVSWAVAFGLFVVGAGAQVLGDLAGWTPILVRVFYLSGAVLVVGYLALGELYLLAGKRISRIAPAIALLVTAVTANLVLQSEVDSARLDAEGWHSLEKSGALVLSAVLINSIGTMVIVGGLVWSARNFKRQGVFRNRMVGCILIAAGTMSVASGGTLTRLGDDNYLYIAMAIGVALIFCGYLVTRRPEPVPVAAPRGVGAAPRHEERPMAGKRSLGERLVGALSTPGGNGNTQSARAGTTQTEGAQPEREAITTVATRPVAMEAVRIHAAPEGDDALGFVGLLLQHDPDYASQQCRSWSVERPDGEMLTRSQARQAWALRLQLDPTSRERFDDAPVWLRAQLTELYAEVLTALPEGSETEAR